ncbi:sigma-54-dependent Fis family transcriptional regulator, partial [Candidatus Desantisbacteria bacterium]|nr:sigma-54-dependent Fis family transcriptional regulator [Candidatus Desantisbacteria bacterium]
ELIANFIHKESPRSKGNFLAINCASLPENLLESELFGHEKGAFTGAVSKRRGIFERADKGTLLLDEIGEITMSLQSKLLRVLQEYKFERVGGESSVSVDVRIIASTNRNLFNEIKNKHFREDLYYRLNVVPLFIPPLRERKEEIPLLSSHFIRKYCKMYNLEIEGISEEALKALMKYQWPGNVRELENCLERASILKRIGKIECNDLSFLEREKCMNSEENISIPKEAAPPLSNFIPEFSGMDVHDLEKEYIFETLKKFNGNRTHTAKALGISVRTIRNRIREYRTMGFAM